MLTCFVALTRLPALKDNSSGTFRSQLDILVTRDDTSYLVSHMLSMVIRGVREMLAFEPPGKGIPMRPDVIR